MSGTDKERRAVDDEHILRARLVDLTRIPLDRLAELTGEPEPGAPGNPDRSVLAAATRRVIEEAQQGCEMFVGHNNHLS